MAGSCPPATQLQRGCWPACALLNDSGLTFALNISVAKCAVVSQAHIWLVSARITNQLQTTGDESAPVSAYLCRQEVCMWLFILEEYHSICLEPARTHRFISLISTGSELAATARNATTRHGANIKMSQRTRSDPSATAATSWHHSHSPSRLLEVCQSSCSQ